MGNVWQRFPNGRKRRELLTDPMTGQSYESYDVDVEEIGEIPLKNNTMYKEGDNDDTMETEDDEFDDQFEEDVQDRKILEDLFQQSHEVVENDVEKSDDFDLSSSRWVAYDTLSKMLDR